MKLVPARTTRTGMPRARAAATRFLALRPGRLEAGVEDLRDADAADDVGRAADVVTLRVRENERRERANTHPGELFRDVRLRRALIDENAGSRRLEQDRVALADVEERHAEARGRVPRRPGRAATQAVATTANAAATSDDAASRRGRGAGAFSLRRTASQRGDARTGQEASAVRVPICALGRSATTRATSSSQAAAQPASDARPAAAAGETGSTIAASEPETENERCGQERDDVREHRVRRRLAEVEEDDRSRREPARERDGERVGDAARAPDSRRAALRTRGTATKIAATAANESWKPGSSSAVGIHAMSTSAPTARKCQRSLGRAASQARDASPPATPARTTDGCQPTARTYDRDDADDRQLTHDPRQAEQPAQPVDAGRQERDVLPRDGQKVVEPGGAEVVLHVRGQALVLAEHDAQHDAAADARGAAPDRPLDAIAKAVAEPGDPAAPADLAPARGFEDDMDALTREPRPLVEAVSLRARLGHADARLQDRAARRRATDGQHEQHALAEAASGGTPAQRRSRASPTATSGPVRP